MRDLLALADDEARDRWDRLALGYTESPGDPALRAAIAGLCEHVSPDQVLVFSGAQEASQFGFCYPAGAKRTVA
jgi:DNA-binding transcriptional MocR family regulator